MSSLVNKNCGNHVLIKCPEDNWMTLFLIKLKIIKLNCKFIEYTWEHLSNTNGKYSILIKTVTIQETQFREWILQRSHAIRVEPVFDEALSTK